MKSEATVNHLLYKQCRGANTVGKLSNMILELLTTIEKLSKYKTLSKKQRGVLEKKWDYYFKVWSNLEKAKIRIGARVSLLNKILK